MERGTPRKVISIREPTRELAAALFNGNLNQSCMDGPINLECGETTMRLFSACPKTRWEKWTDGLEVLTLASFSKNSFLSIEAKPCSEMW